MSSQSQNVQTVRAMLDAFTVRDFSALQTLLSEDFKFEIRPASMSRGVVDRAKFFEQLAGLDHLIAGGSIKFQHIETIDAAPTNQVIAHVKAVDTVSKDGKTPYTNEYLFIATLKNGRIVYWKQFIDSKFVTEFIAATQPKA